jgi:GNAT superfamily N-acetyltransferase
MNLPPHLEPLSSESAWLEAFPIAQVLWPDLSQVAYVLNLHTMTNQGYRLFGLRHDDRLVSIAGVQEIQLLARGKILWLFDMATVPDQQGSGFGRHLLKLLTEYATANGYTRLLLHTSAERSRTIEFYRSELGNPFGVVFRVVTGAA